MTIVYEAKYLPSDYSLCDNGECELAFQCMRRRPQPNAIRAIVTSFKGGKDCEHFIVEKINVTFEEKK